MTVLYTTRSSFGEPLTGSDQLRDRCIGLSPSTETRLLAELFLSQAGVADDVEILETTGEESTAPVPATPTSSPDRSRIRGRTPTTRRSTS